MWVSKNKDTEIVLTKEQLELQKISLEIKYAHRTFLLQALNAFALMAIAIVVFLFFQRPQLDQMSATRLSLERQHIESTLVGIFNMKSDADKRTMLEYLRSEYPQFEFLNSMSKSFEPKKDSTNMKEPIAERCNQIADEIDKLRKLSLELAENAVAEERGVMIRAENSGRAGKGPIYQYLLERREIVENEFAKWQSEFAALKCSHP
jgi:hypothetical protein